MKSTFAPGSRSLFAVLAALLLAAGAASAALCPACAGKMYTMDIGSCASCGGHTSSGAFKLCKACSQKLGECEHCRAKLAAAEKKAAPGFGDAARKPAAPETKLSLGPSDNKRTVKIPAGGRIDIALPGNPTTGYSWAVLSVEGEAVKAEGEIAYKATPRVDRRVGGGGTFTATFRAGQAGTSKIQLGYRRPWEKDVAPIELFTLTVEVGAR